MKKDLPRIPDPPEATPEDIKAVEEEEGYRGCEEEGCPTCASQRMWMDAFDAGEEATEKLIFVTIRDGKLVDLPHAPRGEAPTLDPEEAGPALPASPSPPLLGEDMS